MKYYIIAGERSGDLHGSNLIKALKKKDPKASIRAWGGEYMMNEGADMVAHYKDIAFMGFLEVFQNLPVLWQYIQKCKKDILAFEPDVLILIDFAGFNMRIAKFAKAHQIKVFYYISPKVWAWNPSRALKIKKVVDRMFVILPFEEEFFKKYDYKVDYVGNPLLDAVRAFRPNPNFLKVNNLENAPIIAILPGSRLQEVRNIMPIMMEIIPKFPDYRFVVAGVKNLPESEYHQEGLESDPQCTIVYDQTYDLLSHAHAAVVASGTATLETALFNVPQVVCYKTNAVTYYIGRWVINVPYISLVNLIAGSEIVKELIQTHLHADNLAVELKKILSGFDRVKQLEGYEYIRDKMGNEKASENLARLIVTYLNDYKEQI